MAGESGTSGAGGYAQAMLGVADMLTGASANAAYEAAYGTFYKKYQTMHNAANAKVAAEANIAAIAQDRINTDKVIAMRQDEAEARAIVAAAVSGTEGASLDSVIYQTEVNSSIAKENNRRNAEQQVENQLAQIYQSQQTLLTTGEIDVAKPNLMLDLLQSGATYMSTNREQFMEGIDGLMESSSNDMDVMESADAYGLGYGSGLSLS